MVYDIRFYRVFGVLAGIVATAAAAAACTPFSEARGDAPPMDAGRSVDPTVPFEAAVDAGPACNGAVDCERVVFVTSEVVRGGLIRGVGGADQLCNRLAAASKHPRVAGRSFVAWLSDDTRSPSTSFVHGTKQYVRPDGARIAADYARLTGGSALESPIAIDETGRAQTGLVWSATDPSGEHYGGTCYEWSSQWGEEGAVGAITADAARWTWAPTSIPADVETADCNVIDSRLYCFER